MNRTKNAPSILIAEDDAVTSDVLARLLAKTFPESSIYSAENGRVGLELFDRHTPDIVITDISMPVMDGIEMASEIKAKKADTRFIVLTAYCGNETFLESFSKIGYCDYLTKPIDIKKLLAAIEKSMNPIPQ